MRMMYPWMKVKFVLPNAVRPEYWLLSGASSFGFQPCCVPHSPILCADYRYFGSAWPGARKLPGCTFA
jgi:hypothetical protein